MRLKENLEKLQEEFSIISQQMDELIEENQGEDDPFLEVRNDEKIIKKDIPKRINEITDNPAFIQDLKVLLEYQKLSEKEKDLKKHIKETKFQLDKDLLEKYHHLCESDIKEIVIQDKWLVSINQSIDDEIERISHNLTGRIKQLIKRYDDPMSNLTKDLQTLTVKTNVHLNKMGFRW